MQEETKQILEIVTDMQEQMSCLATKDDLAQLRLEMGEMEKRIMVEIRDIRAELDYLKDRVDGTADYAKEIDELYTRVSALEKKIEATA